MDPLPFVIPILGSICGCVNSIFEGFSPSFIIVVSFIVVYCSLSLWKCVFFMKNHEIGYLTALGDLFYPYLKKIPIASSRFEKEGAQIVSKGIESYWEMEVRDNDIYEMPQDGIPAKEIMERIKRYHKKGDKSFTKGKCTGSVYTDDNEERLECVKEALHMYSFTNPLHVDSFPAVCKFEREVIRMTRELLHGDENCRGLVTSGGSESLELSVLSYRNYCRKKKPWIKSPEILAPSSIHPAVEKACHFLALKLVKVAINEDTLTVSPITLEKHITKNTIAIYGSTPCFPFGIMDDIEGYAKVAKKHSLFLHVDACLGGYYLPFAYTQNLGIPKYDFLVDGVTSISSDTHKFGMAPKGTSVVVFKSLELRNHCFFIDFRWHGGLYASGTFAGSRSGGVIASCWAALMINGKSGYEKVARGIDECRREIVCGIEGISGVKVAGSPKCMVVNIVADAVAQKSDGCCFSVYSVLDEMKKLGWKCQGTQRPSGFHFCITSRSMGMGRQFIHDLAVSVKIAREEKKVITQGKSAVYGMAYYAPNEFLEFMGEGILGFWLDGKSKMEMEEWKKARDKDKQKNDNEKKEEEEEIFENQQS